MQRSLPAQPTEDFPAAITKPHENEVNDMLSLCLMMLATDEAREIFARFYRRYERRLYAVARDILRDPQAAEDVVHDAFTKLADQFERYEKIIRNPCQKTEAWCVIIVKNLCFSRLRRERRLAELLDETWDPPPSGDPVSADAYQRLVALIRSLPDTYRSALELRFVLEWSTAEIARTLGIRENAVSARISRGRRLLLEKLREEGYCDEWTGEPEL